MGDHEAARVDLIHARERMVAAGEHVLRSMLEPQILLSEATLLEQYQPEEALAKIRQALVSFQRDRRSTFIPISYLALARVGPVSAITKGPSGRSAMVWTSSSNSNCPCAEQRYGYRSSTRVGNFLRI